MLVVVVPYTVVQPRTVVVHAQRALLAHAAVVAPVGLKHVAKMAKPMEPKLFLALNNYQAPHQALRSVAKGPAEVCSQKPYRGLAPSWDAECTIPPPMRLLSGR